ncbi:MAG: L-threonylcarbamoyladenylate synthase [Spirochaetales bacterium]|nr:L-threonylcarbamoyladenylate synthase [Spirochaetales bacterium]
MIISRDDPAAARLVADIFRTGGVAVLPCDTIYGLVGPAPESEPRIRKIKGRGERSPFLMLIGDESWMSHYTDQPLPSPLAPFWPGELTLLFRARGSGGAVAFRLPRDPWLRSVLSLTGRPLFSTSVNRSGEPHLWRIDEIVNRYEGEVDAIVTAGDLPEAAPSTILDLTAKPYKVVRQGKVVIPPSIIEESGRV